MKASTWESVKRLFVFCPPVTKHTDTYTVNRRHRDAVQCLCYYFVSSDLSHQDEILPYLYHILEKSLNAKWSLNAGTRFSSDNFGYLGLNK